jgi:hypothetical protein
MVRTERFDSLIARCSSDACNDSDPSLQLHAGERMATAGRDRATALRRVEAVGGSVIHAVNSVSPS